MKSNSVTVLAVAAIVVVGAAMFAVRSRENSAAAGEDLGALFPQLQERINDVAELELVKGEETFTVRLEDGAWGLVERGGYPAKFDNIKGAIVQLAELEIDEPKTSDPAKYERLGVQDPGPGSESTGLTLRDESGGELASVVIGNIEFMRGDQRIFLRRANEEQSFQCIGKLRLDATLTNWIDREVIRLEGDKVREVLIRHANGELVHLSREAEGNPRFLIANLPEGREEKSEGIANTAATSLSYLGLDDVRPASDVDLTAEPLAKVEYDCYNGLKVVVELAKFEDKSWCRLSAIYTDPPAEPEEATDEANPPTDEDPSSDEAAEPEVTADMVAEDEGPSAAEKRAEAKSEAARINRELSPWAFAIPDYKIEAMAKPMEELLEEIQLGPVLDPGDSTDTEPAGAAAPGGEGG